MIVQSILTGKEGVPQLPPSQTPKLKISEKVAIVALAILVGAACGAAVFFLASTGIGAAVGGLALGLAMGAYLYNRKSTHLNNGTNELSQAKTRDRYLTILERHPSITVRSPGQQFVKDALTDKVINEPSKQTLDLLGETLIVPLQTYKDINRTERYSLDGELLIQRTVKEEEVELKESEEDQKVMTEKRRGTIIDNYRKSSSEQNVPPLSQDNLNKGIYEHLTDKFNDVHLVDNLLKISNQAMLGGITIALYNKVNRMGDDFSFMAFQNEKLGFEVDIDKKLRGDKEVVELKILQRFDIKEMIDGEKGPTIKKVETIRTISVLKDSMAHDLEVFFADPNCTVTDTIRFLD